MLARLFRDLSKQRFSDSFSVLRSACVQRHSVMSRLDILEDLNHPLMGPTLKGLKIWKIWQPNHSSSGFFHKYSVHIIGTLFVVTQYVELWLIKDNLELALRNLSVTMLSTICVVKALSFVFWHNNWSNLINYVSTLEKEQLSKNDFKTTSVIGAYTKYSRRITYFYWCLVTATVFTVILAPLFGFISSDEHRYLIRNGSAPNPEILSSWLPFNRTRSIGYWISIVEHSAICVYGGGVVANFDSNAVVLMSFFNGQLKLLSQNCARLFGETDESISSEEAAKRIMECHNHHVGLIKYSSMLNFLLSPVMFLYVIICSLMICASAIQLTMEGTGTMQRIWIAEYLAALIAQLFLYCWHSNEVLHMSNKVEDGVYVSGWWSRDVRVRRSVLLLGGQLRRSVVFKAGPFTDLTVATFVAILKGAYSYYTLLSKKED